MKRLIVASLIALFACGAGAAAAAPPKAAPDMQPYMKPVNSVLAAMTSHNARSLDGAYAPDAVIVDDEAPYQWSGNTGPTDWLSALTTFGKLHYARFTALADPMELSHGPDNAYITVLGRLRGTGPRANAQQYAALTFSLRKVGDDWKITSQSWTRIPPVNLSAH